MKTAFLALLAAVTLQAQEPAPTPAPAREPPPRTVRQRENAPAPMGVEPTRNPPPGADPIMGNLFPPDLIMQNQDAIGLTDEQRTFMMSEVERTQGAVAGTQWRLQAAMERLGSILRTGTDEGPALAQLDSVLALERDMKRAQIGLLVRLKSHLTADQQASLRRLREREGPRDE